MRLGVSRLTKGCLLPLAALAALAALAWWKLYEPGPGRDALQDAIASGDAAAVRAALDAGADPNLSDYGVPPPLVAAVAKGRPDLARVLLERGADPDRPGAEAGDLTPLATALAAGDAELQRLLLEAGADPAGPGASGAPLLFDAVRAKDGDAVRRLVDAGAEVDVRDTSGLAWDEAMGLRVRAARELAEHMGEEAPALADPEHLTGVTPLMLAARSDGLAVLEALLERGADVNARDDAGATPLAHAARSAWTSPEVLRRLVAAGADPEATDVAGRTPIDYAGGPELPRPGIAELLREAARGR